MNDFAKLLFNKEQLLDDEGDNWKAVKGDKLSPFTARYGQSDLVN